MSDESQITIPQSFIALFMEPGYVKPNAPRETILARYELCEDLANLLTEHVMGTHREFGITPDEILERIFRGLLVEASIVKAAEARWVTRRLAELLAWRYPSFDWCPD